jgi:hypothetical protein
LRVPMGEGHQNPPSCPQPAIGARTAKSAGPLGPICLSRLLAARPSRSDEPMTIEADLTVRAPICAAG